MNFSLHRPSSWAQTCSAGLVACVCVLTLVTRVEAQAAPEPEIQIDLLDNGSGFEISNAADGDARRLLVPWWIASGTKREVPPTLGALELAAGSVLSQPIAAYAPLAHRLLIKGRVEGQGHVRLFDGRGEVIEIDVRDQEFEIAADPFTAKIGHTPLPRFTLEISAAQNSPGAKFHDLHAMVSLPCPSEAALRLELGEMCDAAFKIGLERGVDRDGARKTAFLTTRFDAVTGEIQPGRSPQGLHPFYESLLDASAVFSGDTGSANDVWNAGLEAFLKDFFELTFHPATGLPRDWDGELDLPQDAKAIQVGRYLTFLLDVSERGPQAFRKRALEQAERMAATILAHGKLPDGSLAVMYVPADGTPNLDVQAIRQLDVAAPLARLSRMNGDARLALAARSALAQLEFVHFWGGTWSGIDPDFDDSYGNWGSKTTTMLAAFPNDPVFLRFTARGVEHFAPMWRDALRFGGSIAADQQRCWEFLLRYEQVEPTSRELLEPLLRSALRAHFKGEQYDNGAWADLSFASFSPRTLNVGDFSGYPHNLVLGLATMYRQGSGLRNDETRAMFTAVLRSSKQRYGRKFGWLSTREESKDINPAGAEVKMLMGATEMLKNLAK